MTAPLHRYTPLVAQRLRLGSAPDPDAHQGEFEGLPAIFVNSFDGLVRTLGLLKYELREHRVLFRGQTGCWGGLSPTLYRRINNHHTADPAVEACMQAYRQAMNRDLLPHQAATTEPLLQHYGVHTRWVDLVDSIPHALFFAVWQMAQQGSGSWSYGPSESPKGVFYLVDCGAEARMKPVEADGVVVSGLWEEDGTGFQLCDLRRAKPSKALRPHSQHGWLARPAPGKTDLWDRVLLRIVIPTDAGQRWLGPGTCVSPAALFPAPGPDRVFSRLLSQKMQDFFDAQDPRFGSIQRFAFHED